MDLSSTGGHGRGGQTGRIVGDVINHGKHDFWGVPNTHYHRGMRPGENTVKPASEPSLLIRPFPSLTLPGPMQAAYHVLEGPFTKRCTVSQSTRAAAAQRPVRASGYTRDVRSGGQLLLGPVPPGLREVHDNSRPVALPFDVCTTLKHSAAAIQTRFDMIRNTLSLRPGPILQLEWPLQTGSHNDTYAESYHRDFFKRWSEGVPPEDCSKGTEGHNTASIGGFVTLPPVILGTMVKALQEKATTTEVLQEAKLVAKRHLYLTHDSKELGEVADLYTELLVNVSQGANLRETVQNFARERLLFDLEALVAQDLEDAQVAAAPSGLDRLRR